MEKRARLDSEAMTQFNLYFALHNTPIANDMTFGQWDWEARPLSVLCSFALKGALKSWKNRQYPTPGVKTILDSGAFSAWKTGTPVSMADLIAEAYSKEWDEVAALDVIGSGAASKVNAFEMDNHHNLHGRVLPVFHYGEPWEYLTEYKNSFGNRVALGGITSIGSVKKMKWLEQCFAREYPCSFHGFGIGTRDVLMAFPFASADTASWGSVHMFGRSAALPGLKIGPLGDGDRAQHYDLRFEVAKYVEMEDEVRERWAKELISLDSHMDQ